MTDLTVCRYCELEISSFNHHHCGKLSRDANAIIEKLDKIISILNKNKGGIINY